MVVVAVVAVVVMVTMVVIVLMAVLLLWSGVREVESDGEGKWQREQTN